MVCAWLPVERRINCVSLSVLDVALLLQEVELPADEGVEVRVLARRDEGPPPVGLDAESLEVGGSSGREVVEPVLRLLEWFDLGVRYSQLLQNLVLRQLLASGRLDLTLAKFPLDPVGGSLDRHASAMVSKREEDSLSSLLFVPGRELGLRERKSVAQMEESVHVWESKRDQILAVVLLLHSHRAVVLGRVLLKVLGGVSLPHCLHLQFHLPQSVEASSRLLLPFSD